MRWKIKEPRWRPWFAWRPVNTNGHYVWLEWMERLPAHGQFSAGYRIPDHPVAPTWWIKFSLALRGYSLAEQRRGAQHVRNLIARHGTHSTPNDKLNFGESASRKVPATGSDQSGKVR